MPRQMNMEAAIAAIDSELDIKLERILELLARFNPIVLSGRRAMRLPPEFVDIMAMQALPCLANV